MRILEKVVLGTKYLYFELSTTTCNSKVRMNQGVKRTPYNYFSTYPQSKKKIKKKVDHVPILCKTALLVESGNRILSQFGSFEMVTTSYNNFGLSLISKIMNWDDDLRALDEFKWLKLIARTKYDHYSGFYSGSGFIENLAIWLKQFEPKDREIAYEYIKKRLIFISSAELSRLIESFVPEIVFPIIRSEISRDLNIPMFEIQNNDEVNQKFVIKLRCCLFMGLSDGARTDLLRRFNTSVLSPEQIVSSSNIDNKKWIDMNEKLQNDIRKLIYESNNTKFNRLNAKKYKFSNIFLFDDFTASGTTFIRYIDGEWKGKLDKFFSTITEAKSTICESEFPISKNCKIFAHHYISTQQANDKIKKLLVKYMKYSCNKNKINNYVINVSYSHILPENLKLCTGIPEDNKIIELCEKYYNSSLSERLKDHLKETKQHDIKLGYANCALPLILEHNTPNNSIALLWARATSESEHHMCPLFIRRDRHGG